MRTTRTSAALVALIAVAAVAAGTGDAREGSRSHAARAGAAPPPVFLIAGRGWGHGVGMSQYGAYGFAQKGIGYARILAHYYPGTSLAAARVSKVRVLLTSGKRSVTVSSTVPLRVRDASGTTHDVDATRVVVTPALKVKIRGEAKPQALPGPLSFSGVGGAVALNGKPYRGSLDVDVEKVKLRVINAVGLEQYLYGVVPDEVPPHWPVEALKAQAVVARSYALAVKKTGAFDLYADVRSQVYGGVASEEPSTNAAVDATARQVLSYGGRVATTFFFSTSGGRTANVTDVWPGSRPTPYLVSVPDPYDSISPHHTWGPFRFAPETLAKALKVRGKLLDVETVVNASGRVSTVTATGTEGTSSMIGGDVRRTLGLRSTWFRIGVLALDPPKATPLVYGGRATITGRVRGLGAAALEQQVSSSIWEKAAVVKPAENGTFAVQVAPASSTTYRLAVGKVATGGVRIGVAPLVKLRPVTGDTQLRGFVRPLLPGASVAVQRLAGPVWKTVATAKIDGGGNFVATLKLAPGTYRARVSPTRGFSAGISAVVEVVSP